YGSSTCGSRARAAAGAERQGKARAGPCAARGPRKPLRARLSQMRGRGWRTEGRSTRPGDAATFDAVRSPKGPGVHPGAYAAARWKPSGAVEGRVRLGRI